MKLLTVLADPTLSGQAYRTTSDQTIGAPINVLWGPRDVQIAGWLALGCRQ